MLTLSCLKNTKKGDQRLCFNINQWGLKVSFDIMNDISENITLVKFMDTVGNVNNAVSIVGHWTFDSNYKTSPPSKT